MSNNDRVKLDRWDVGALRYSVFLGAKSKPDTSAWWAKVVGQPPESTFAEQRNGVRRDIGSVEFGTLHLISQPYRIDWQLLPIDAMQPIPPFAQMNVPNIGSLVSVIDLFWSLLEKAIYVEEL